MVSEELGPIRGDCQRNKTLARTIRAGETENPLPFGRFHQTVFSMKQAAFFLPVILLVAGCGLFRSDERPVEYNPRAAQLAYIEKYKDVAIAEMKRSGIPASIIMAQAMLESASGLSELSQKANNHFGLKCTSQWTGATFQRKDDDRDSAGSVVESCFRRYNNVAESYADHGEFIRDRRQSHRYGFLFELDRTDYKSWTAVGRLCHFNRILQPANRVDRAVPAIPVRPCRLRSQRPLHSEQK
jgi:hypothetical protein